MSAALRVLSLGEQVGCYFCIEEGNHVSYGRGEAFLASAGHSPLDGNANYVCKRHLDDDTVVRPAPGDPK
jgi:hypothetical protein